MLTRAASCVLAVSLLCLATQAAVAQEKKEYIVAMALQSKDWQAVRLKVSTGQAWYATGGNWKAIADAGDAPPAGHYEVLVFALGDADWGAIRYNATTGQSWRMVGYKWVEMKTMD